MRCYACAMNDPPDASADRRDSYRIETTLPFAWTLAESSWTIARLRSALGLPADLDTLEWQRLEQVFLEELRAIPDPGLRRVLETLNAKLTLTRSALLTDRAPAAPPECPLTLSAEGLGFPCNPNSPPPTDRGEPPERLEVGHRIGFVLQLPDAPPLVDFARVAWIEGSQAGVALETPAGTTGRQLSRYLLTKKPRSAQLTE